MLVASCEKQLPRFFDHEICNFVHQSHFQTGWGHACTTAIVACTIFIVHTSIIGLVHACTIAVVLAQRAWRLGPKTCSVAIAHVIWLTGRGQS